MILSKKNIFDDNSDFRDRFKTKTRVEGDQKTDPKDG
jgi:hypothetical protein